MLILAALDFSSAMNSVVRATEELAKRTGARVVLLHVEAPEPDFVGYEPGPQTVRDARARDIQSDDKQLHEVQKKLASDGIEAEVRLIQGPTVDKIVEEAKRENAGYIVMGSHGHGALYELVMGSVTDGVLRHSPCPVVIVPVDRGDTKAEEA